MQNKRKNTFYCFSPPVMIATFAIEISLLLYTIWRYKMTAITRLVATIVGLLAVFQFAEYHVCQSISGDLYSRIGFIAITFLPPLSLHLVSVISKRGSQALIRTAYATGTAFALVFGFSSFAFQSHVCAGNYAVFQLADNLGGMYFGYYYFWLLLGIGMCMYYSITAARKIREALIFQAAGYLSFILPTGIVNALHPTTITGIPSIMCGFAVVYALVLTFGITPRVLPIKHRAKTRTI